MKKEIIRRHALVIRTEGKTYPEIIKVSEERFNVKVSQRTLRRWWKKLSTTEWDLFQLRYILSLRGIESIMRGHMSWSYTLDNATLIFH